MAAKRAEGVRLAPAALADLEAVWRWTAAHFSPEQADRYLRGLHRTFALLAANPRLAPERREIRPPVRIFRHRAHIVVYRIERSRILVLRIRHAREDWWHDPSGEADR